MKEKILKYRKRLFAGATALTLVSIAGLVGVFATVAHGDSAYFYPGNLVVARSLYVDGGNIVAGTTVLPPDCSPTNCPTSVYAIAASAYPYVFNNGTVDGSFGVTTKIFLDQITPTGTLVTSLEVPNSSQNGVPPTKDQMVTSFSSKSELALNLSTGGDYLTFMGYFAPVSAIDVSNSNTPGEVDPTVAPGIAYYRSVAQVDQHGKFNFTKTNAFTGDNGRAAILNDMGGANLFYMAGNAGNGSQVPQPVGVIIGTGAQMTTPQVKAEVAQNPGTPTAVGSFNISQLGLATDKIGKDTNFRGMTIYNNVLYYTKGSGSNGINTVYFVDTTGSACTDGGIGLPVPGATLPTSPLAYNPNPTIIQTDGMVPDNMCILKGLPNTTASTSAVYPFGVWFASPTVMYVADEGDGYASGLDLDSHAATSTGGVQKWIFGYPTAGQWNFAYTLTNGLGLGVPYTVTGYPTGLNLATCVVPKGTPSANNPNNCPTTKALPKGSPYSALNGLPWAPATDGLRNITGVVNGDGTATIYAITSTVSGGGDQGADPNQLVMITDTLSATGSTPPAGETFTVVVPPAYGQVLRGVAWAPGTAKH